VQYPVSADERAELFTLQQGVCAICTKRLRNANDGVVDHDHVTGIVRGMLCIPCNTGLGFFRDSPRRLVRAVMYLKPFVVEPERDALLPRLPERPPVSICEGSFEPPFQIQGTRGPGMFRCAECDRADIRVSRIGRHKGRVLYMVEQHLRREDEAELSRLSAWVV
jgi:hypothetical protein